MNKLKRKLKRGFTLVELLVVIAIISVLAAVSVVGYIGFTDRAKKSNDIALTTEMNNILTANRATEGKNATCYEAFADLENGGINIANFKVTSHKDYSYGWDSANDKIPQSDRLLFLVVHRGTRLIAR